MPVDAISPLASLEVKQSALAPATAIRLSNAGLNERADGEIVAHGWLDLDSIRALRVDDYQREVLGAVSSGKKPSLRRAVEKGAHLPDIMIGMRGENYDTAKGGAMLLRDRCYIVDGLQRIAALLHHAESNPDEAANVSIGAEVRFNTTKESEKELFLVLNTSRIPVSPNVILRNLREKHPSILTLYGLSHVDAKFALCERVSWNQRMARSELLTALMLSKAALALHMHSYTQGIRAERAQALANILDGYAADVGLPAFRRNVTEFFDIVDQCFGIRNVQYKEVSPQLKGNFLNTLARVLAAHTDFWEGTKLKVDAATRRKLAAFPINDPEVVRLAAAGNMAMPILFTMLVDHLNKGKSAQRRLHKRV